MGFLFPHQALLLRADARAIPLRDQSVHCVVTSPPYWGLRDYGTGGQLGLESTPEEYLANMVAVFREVWRVLRDDGTAWVNMGSSYASGDMNPSRFPPLWHARAYGSDGKSPLNSVRADRAYLGSDDEHLSGTQSHHARTAHNDQCAEQTRPPPLMKGHDSGHQASASKAVAVVPLGVLASTKRGSSLRPLASCGPATMDAGGPSTPQTYDGDGSASSCKEPCNSDIASMLPPLVVRTSGKEPFYSACHSPDCRGLGRCGLCWCSLTIPFLNVKHKDDITIPHLLAMALRADGWYLRSPIIFSKKNPMPESVRDRPTKAHEYVFLLSKRGRYFYDADAVREENSNLLLQECINTNPNRPHNGVWPSGTGGRMGSVTSGRNLRDVWHIATQPYPEAHFATYPEKLVEPCVKAGTSQRGVCEKCGAPWGRVVENPKIPTEIRNRGEETKMAYHTRQTGGGQKLQNWRIENPPTTTGWRPSCSCDAGTVPAIVFDPFGGSGTTAAVALKLGRRAVAMDIGYHDLARRRVYGG